MEPATLCGAVIGVLLNGILPSWLIVLLLVILFALITKKTLLKAMKLHKKETQRKQYLLRRVFTGPQAAPGDAEAGRDDYPYKSWSLYPRFNWKIAAKRWRKRTQERIQARSLLLQDQKDIQKLERRDKRKE